MSEPVIRGGTRAPHLAVVGGGISGLTTALACLDLARQRGLATPRITVLESAPVVGGKIRTLHEEGFTCEWGVNGFLAKEPKTLELCQRLNLQDRLFPAADAFNNRYIYTGGRLRSVQMHPLKFLLSGLLPVSAMLRLMCEPWIPRRTGAGDESVADFARRRVGPVGLQVLVDPMQTGIFGGDPEQMSVASCFPRVVEVERDYGSLIGGMAKIARERKAAGQQGPSAGPSGHLTSFKGGMEVLIQALAEQLGHRVRTGAAVQRLARTEHGFRLTGEGLELDVDQVVLACPAHAATGITAELDPELSQLLDQIPYAPMAVVCLGYPRQAVAHPMDGFGFLAPRTAGLRILGALWTSSIFPGRSPDDTVLIRVMVGGARDPEVMQLDDDQLVQLVHGELGTAMGAGDRPSFVRIFRHQRAIPQYVLGHGQRLAQLEQRLARLPGLLITGNAYKGVGVNDCAREAWEVAARVLA